VKRVVVVGAGVAGLTLAERLLSSRGSQISLQILERGSRPGGLARTFAFGDYLFDVGPHRFHTMDGAVLEYVRDVLEGRSITIPRASSVYLLGRYHTWPLTLGTVLRLPLRVLLPSFLDLFRRSGGEVGSFADHIRNRYGPNLYSFFFSGYTRKFTGLDAEELHSDWAEAGVNRAVIDRRVRADSLLSLLGGLLIPRPVSTSFIYPSDGGIQTFSDILAHRISSMGGALRTCSPAAGILEENGRAGGVRLEDGEEIEADEVYWSAPLSVLYPEAGLRFINTVLYCVGLSRPQGNQYQWCYFGQEDISFSRTTVPSNFSASSVPAGRGSITAEVTCSPDCPVWRDPDSLSGRILADLERVEALEPGCVEFVHPLRIAQTYPMYDLGYRRRLETLRPPEGLHLLGRCGSFWYNNMDHSIAQAMAMAGGGETRRDFWTEA
jgi:protoporphyrinogen oxidase